MKKKPKIKNTHTHKLEGHLDLNVQNQYKDIAPVIEKKKMEKKYFTA